MSNGRKRGGQPGNKNAVGSHGFGNRNAAGHGAPRFNRNAQKHGVYSMGWVSKAAAVMCRLEDYRNGIKRDRRTPEKKERDADLLRRIYGNGRNKQTNA